MSRQLVATARHDPNGARKPQVDSGELGPLAPPFAEVITGMRSAIIPMDQARDHIADERRQLGKRVQEITNNLEASTHMLRDLQEKRTAAQARVREIEEKPGHFSRQDIVKAYQDFVKLDADHTRLNELCEHLRLQHDAAQRAQKALDMALNITADAAFLRDDAPPRPITTAFSSQLDAPRIDQEALLSAREYERHVLARTIDERVRQGLSDLVLLTEMCESTLRANPVQAGEVTKNLKNRLHDALRATDTLIFELEPVILADLGLAATLQRYAQDTTATQNAQVTTRITGAAQRCHIAIERAAFRVAREAVMNALRHGHAAHIEIILNMTADALYLAVLDDGAGFDVDAVLEQVRRGYHSGLGQLCLETDLIGAELGIESAPTHGARIDFVVADLWPRT